MAKTLQISLATVVASLSFAGSAYSQPADGGTDAGRPPCVEDNTCAEECVQTCLTPGPACVTSLDPRELCKDYPSCMAMSDVDNEMFRRVCVACHDGGQQCQASKQVIIDYTEIGKHIGTLLLGGIPQQPAEAKPKPQARPASKPTASAPKPPAPKPVATGIPPQGGVTKADLDKLQKLLDKLQRDIEEMKKLPPKEGVDPDALAAKIAEKLKGLLAQPSVPAEVKAATELTVKDLDRALTAHELGDAKQFGTQSQRMDKQDDRLEDLENRVSSLLGFELNVLANIHALTPYDNAIWGVWPEFFWLPEVADGWRLELGSGIGYAGSPDPEDDPLHVVPLTVGVMPRVTDGFHLGFGFQGEWRIDPSEHLRYSSYGGYLEPKICPGGGDEPSEGSDLPMKTPPHFFCFGARLALEATIFQHPFYADPAEAALHPDMGETYTLPDGSFSFFVGYAFLP